MPIPAEQLKSFVKMANAHQKAMHGKTPEECMQLVKAVLASSDVVLGVWQDPEADHGVGYTFIKGGEILDRIVGSGRAEQVKMSAIPCDCEEQAIAARKVLASH